jgi:glutathione synthase/RimK-type ligase-like ATP-grasp enzyme
MIPRIAFRLANISFSRDFVHTLTNSDIMITRKNFFNRSRFLINHGSASPISIGREVGTFYVVNQPSHIRYCSNKMMSAKFLPRYYPDYYTSLAEIRDYPVIAKPLHGHHGVGIRILSNRHEARRFFERHSFNNYIVQELIPISHEYRVNIFDREIFQVSEKIKLEEHERRGGIEFDWRSLGENASLNPRFYAFLNNVISDFHKKVGYNLGSYCFDVMKSKDNDYYLCEINSAYGIGELTLNKLLAKINRRYDRRKLEPYRVR